MWRYTNRQLVSARSTQEAKKLDPTGIVLFRQADVGEYLREVSLIPVSMDCLVSIQNRANIQ